MITLWTGHTSTPTTQCSLFSTNTKPSNRGIPSPPFTCLTLVSMNRSFSPFWASPRDVNLLLVNCYLSQCSRVPFSPPFIQLQSYSIGLVVIKCQTKTYLAYWMSREHLRNFLLIIMTQLSSFLWLISFDQTPIFAPNFSYYKRPKLIPRDSVEVSFPPRM